MEENESGAQSPTDYHLTFFEACEFLSKSKKSLGRYIRRGLITPQKTKSLQGTLEYRFSRTDLENFKKLSLAEQTGQTRQDTPDRTDQPPHELEIRENSDQTGQTRQDTPDRTDKTPHDEMVEFLKEQIKVKDEQIGQLMERDREVNVILKNLHDKIFRLETPKEKSEDQPHN